MQRSWPLCDLDSARVVTAKNSFFPYDADSKELKFSSLWASPVVSVNGRKAAWRVQGLFRHRCEKINIF